MKFKRIRNLHFLGIGGTGMCGIAEVLLNSGYKITGSDIRRTETTASLENLGIKITYSHTESNVKDCDVVVVSSAVSEDNPEIVAARKRKIPVISRAEMLAELMRMKFSIAVAGTHGKTTTTSLIGHVLSAGGFDPTVIVGGRVLGVGSNAYLGAGDYLVAEADEYDRSISRFYPTIAVITGIEAEHMECYADLDDLENCFVEFANRVPFFGAVVICNDDPGIKRIEARISRPVMSYGLSGDVDLSASDISFSQKGTSFIIHHRGKKQGRVASPLLGYHNVRNVLAAIAVAHDLEIPFETAIGSVATFPGVGRRLQLAGEVKGVSFYDDYGHHPTEIKTTIQGLRAVHDGRLVVVFQPHLYSRTQRFHKQFAEALAATDLLFILAVYPSREKPIDGVTGRMIADAARAIGHKNVSYIDDKSLLPDIMKQHLRPGDRVILFGAGDIYKLTPEIMERLEE